MNVGTKIKLYGTACVGLLLLFTVLDGYFTVNDKNSERAILTRFGQFERIVGPGLHLKVPYVESVLHVTTEMQQMTNVKAPVNTYTVDNQEVDIIWTVFYATPSEQLEFVFKNVPDQQTKLMSLITDRLKAEMGKVNVQDFAAKRGEIRDRIKTVLAHDALTIGAAISDFQITNADYAKSFRAAVEQAAAAKAQVETKEQEMRQAQIQAQTAQIVAKGEADRAREAAKGQAEAILVKAQASAKATELQGAAEATAIRAKSDALSQNGKLVDLTLAERWNGVSVPTNSFGATPVPLVNIPLPK